MIGSLPLLLDEVIFRVEETWKGGQKRGLFIVPKGTKRKDALTLASINTYGLILKGPEEVVYNKEIISLFLDKKTSILG